MSNYPSPTSPSWGELVRLEPRLGDLLADAHAVQDDSRRPYFCQDDVYRTLDARRPGLKERLCRLVGWGAEQDDRRLRSCAAYDIACETITDALPPCRECGCVRV